MSLPGVQRPLPASLFARLSGAARYAISGVAPNDWFGPQQPLPPQAPAEAKGRQFDYAFGANLNYTPRSNSAISFADLRALADALPLLRAVIETRKDQVAALNWSVRLRRGAPQGDAKAVPGALAFLSRPDRIHGFEAWLRMLLEDLLVIDAATIYPRLARDGALHSLDVIDGATIFPLIGADGRAPDAPDPAYQQILHGVPAADFTRDELLYLPRNTRAHRLYGMSPVEQIALTVNIALRRDAATLEYYNSGSMPDAFATLPKEWTMDQIRQFQDYFESILSGNLARRRMLKFMPAEFTLHPTRQPPLKDQYDEWLARVICYAFSVPPSPFITQVNRASGQTMQQQATQEGLIPLRNWIKGALDRVLADYLRAPSLEFTWVGDDAVNPLEQAKTLEILVAAGIKTTDEARAELGLEGAGAAMLPLGKDNPYHDEVGRFTTPENAATPSQGDTPTSTATGARSNGVQVASLDRVASDAVPGGASSVTFATATAASQADNPDPSLGGKLASYLQSNVDSPAGIGLVIRSEKERLKADDPPPDRITWLHSLGIDDERQILAYLSTAPATDILASTSLPGAPSADVIAAVKTYGKQCGIEPQILLDIIAFETGGTFDPRSKNPVSTASGLFQIMGDTWRGIADRLHLTDVFDVDQNVHAGAINLTATMRTLSANGIADPSEEQLYFAHQQGGGGAAVLLGNPDMKAVDALNLLSYYSGRPGSAAEAIVKNGGSVDITAKEFFTFMTARFRATARRTPRIDAE